MRRQYHDLIKHLFCHKDVDESTRVEKNAKIAMVYIHAYLDQIKQMQEYVPIHELRLLIDRMSPLAKDSKLLPSLFPLLCTLMDLCFERGLKGVEFQAYLNMIKGLISDLPIKSQSLLALDYDSTTFMALLELGVMPVPSRGYDIDELSSQLQGSLQEQQQNLQEYKIKYSQSDFDAMLTTFKVNSNILRDAPSLIEESSHHALNELLLLHARGYCGMENFSAYGNDFAVRMNGPRSCPYIKQKIFKDLVTLLLSQCKTQEDKTSFVDKFLRCCETLFAAEIFSMAEAESLLYFIVYLIPIFNKALQAGELCGLLNGLKVTDKMLENYSSASNTYFSTLSFFLGFDKLESKLESFKKRRKGFGRFEDGLLLINNLENIISYPKRLEMILQIPVPQDGVVLTPGLVSSIPVDMQLFLMNNGIGLTSSVFVNFLKHYHHINDGAGVYQQRNITALFIQYERKIQQLVLLMGHGAIEYMRQLISNTVLPLEKMLEDIPLHFGNLIDFLTDYYVSQYVKSFEDCEFFKMCLMMSSLVDKTVMGQMSDDLIIDMSKWCRLSLMSDLNGANPTETDQLYLEKNTDGDIHYKVFCDAGHIYDGVISSEELPGIKDAQLDNKNIKSFKKIEQQIINMTSKRGHTLSNHKSPKDFLNTLVTFLLRGILGEISVKLNSETLQQIFKKISLDKLGNLIDASHRMLHNQYQKIFLELLKRDFFGEDIDTFLHSLKQESEIGKDLARHNGSIRRMLVEKGVDPDKALAYQGKHEFMITPSVSSGSIENLYSVLLSYLRELEKQSISLQLQPDLHDKAKMQLHAIIGNISQLEQKIAAKRMRGAAEVVAITAVLSDVNNSSLLKKITSNCEALKVLKEKNPDLTASFFEFADHVKEQRDLIAGQAPKSSAVPSQASRREYFTVKQWSKADSMTFFLGDEVGCCLASDGAQFQAMVQRRMDDAMLFHVAIDQSTGRPAALIWLYLAETADKKIVLMANFFEVKTKFGLDNDKRKALCHGLLQFTQQYLEDNPTIDGFYMNQLSYGWCQRDLVDYPVEVLMGIDKLGGPYIPGGIGGDVDQHNPEIQAQIQQMTKEMYFLASLHQSEFHKFSKGILEQTRPTKMLSLSELIQTSVSSCKEKGFDLKATARSVIQQHGVDLGHFYANPEENAELKAMLRSAYENPVVPRPVRPSSPRLAASRHAEFWAQPPFEELPPAAATGGAFINTNGSST